MVSVHPRMRGERSAPSRLILVDDGSSPHARGTPDAHDAETVQRRFIPACAGNACGGARTPSACAVHPRMRGERVSSCQDT